MSYRRSNNNHLHFCEAIEKGDKITAQNLLSDDIDINANVRGNTLLDWAIIKSEDLDIIIMLLDKGINVHDKNYNNAKPLYVAIQYNKTEAVSLLIRRGALIGENLNSVLLMAIEKNNLSMIKILIDHGMQYDPSIDLKNSFDAAVSRGQPEIIECIIPHCRFLEPSDKYIPRKLVIRSEPQNTECVKVLLKWNFSINPYSRYDEDFIYAAVEKGNLPIVLQLLKLGINVDIVNSNTGLNLLAIACLNKHHEVVETLLQHNANVNMTIISKYSTLINQWYIYCDKRNCLEMFPSGHGKRVCNITCLDISVFNSDPIITELLLRYGAKISDDPQYLSITAIALENGFDEIVRMFLEHCVNVDETDLRGRTLLHFCVQVHMNIRDSSIECKTTPNVIQLLLEHDANIEAIDAEGWTPLALACSLENIVAVKCLLENNANPNVTNYEGQTPLHLCCEFENEMTPKIIQLLLEHGANIEALDAEGCTPLFLACSLGNVVVVKCLLENKANLNAKNCEGQTPLHLSCKLENKTTPKIIQLLLEHGANIEAVNAEGWTPLFFACSFGNIDTTKCLLENNANPNAKNCEGQTLLHLKCKFESKKTPKIIELLLEYGANIEALDAKGWTPLFFACSFGNIVTAKCLLRNNANPNAKNYKGQTSLHLSCKFESKTTTKIIQLLLRHGANIEALDADGWTPLFFACSFGNIDTTKYLLENNANPNVKNCKGQGPLHLSCKFETNTTSKIIQLLLKHGANIEAVNAKGRTPLFFACFFGNIVATRCLLKNRANLHAKSGKGQTPLHLICKFESEKTSNVIQLLLKHGANIEALDAKRRTPLLIACDYYNCDAVKCLLNHNANVNHADSKRSTPLHIAVKQKNTTMIEDLLKYGANVHILDGRFQTPLQNAVENILLYNVNSDGTSKNTYPIKMLVSQEIKLKTAGLSVNNRSLNIVCNPNDYITIDNVKYSAIDILQLNIASDFNNDKTNNIELSHNENSIGDIRNLEMKCKQEIATMKTESVGINEITFYNLLKQHIHLLGKCVKNEEIEKIVNQDIYNKKFPLYINIVRNRLRDAKLRYRRYKLRKFATKYFRLNISQQLPDECIDAVLRYLSIKELEAFVGLFEQLNS